MKDGVGASEFLRASLMSLSERENPGKLNNHLTLTRSASPSAGFAGEGRSKILTARLPDSSLRALRSE